MLLILNSFNGEGEGNQDNHLITYRASSPLWPYGICSNEKSFSEHERIYSETEVLIQLIQSIQETGTTLFQTFSHLGNISCPIYNPNELKHFFQGNI